MNEIREKSLDNDIVGWLFSFFLETMAKLEYFDAL
jgi:hypothetical protein